MADAFGRMLFQDWTGLARTALVGVLAYAALVVLLRISGKRTLAKMNAFDLVVTVALGSTLATILLTESVALAEGVTAFVTLVGLQYAVAWASVRSSRVSGLVKSEPRMLLYRGEMLRAALRAERVTEDEVRSAIRSANIADVVQVEAVVLETDGTFSVVERTGAGEDATSLAGVSRGTEATAP